jgi:methylated-DNA-[protein]-cysteine S-methyltransferase
MRQSAPETLSLDRLESPIGAILVVHDAQNRLRALDFSDYETRMRRLLRLHNGQEGLGFVLDERTAPPVTRHALENYFAGQLSAIDTIDVSTAGTPFQRCVWAALRSIRAGSTLSYGALARRIGRPKAVRAVGLANGANPIGIVVPCHRVIGSDASLTGYGGGVARKRWLLNHEGIQFATSSVDSVTRIA